MRRALLIAVLVLLVGDASGLTSLFVPEACAIGASDSAPDSGCPAFCVRCTCPCCVSSAMHQDLAALTTAAPAPIPVPLPNPDRLPAGIPHDIFHVPKTLLT